MFRKHSPGCPCCQAEPDLVFCIGPEDPCQTVWPRTLYITDANGTHEMSWNSGVGWTCCYMTPAQESAGESCEVSSSPVMVRYFLNCPGDNGCDVLELGLDYQIKDCVSDLGAYYLGNYIECGETPSNTYSQPSDSYTSSPVAAEWTFPATIPDAPVDSPLPVSGTITLSE